MAVVPVVRLAKTSGFLRAHRYVFRSCKHQEAHLAKFYNQRMYASASSYITQEWKEQMLREKLLRSPYKPNQKIPETSLPEFAFPLMEKHGNNMMMINGITGERFTYHDCLRHVERVSSGLIKKGLKPGDKVAICSFNQPEYVISFLSVWACGGTTVEINPNCTEKEFKQQIDDTNSSHIICHPECAAKSKNVAAATPTIQNVIVFGDHEGCIPFRYFLEDDGTAFKGPHPVGDPRLHLAQLPGSSGTTGLPKFVCKSHYAMTAMALSFCHEALETDHAGAVGLLVLPLYHTFPVMVVLMHIVSGAGNVLLPKFVPATFLESIQNFKVSTISVVPPLALFLAQHEMVKNFDLSSLKYLNCGAAPIAPEIMNNLKEKLNLNVIRQGYGMTEICPVAVGDVESSNVRSVGRPTPLTEIKFIDVDTGEQLGPNIKGELVARNPTQMNSYLNNPDATSHTIRDGWIYSGDIGYYNEEGEVFVVDRLKDLIKYKGHQVAPTELENVLLSHAAVRDVAVIGMPDQRAGELARAFVVLDSKVIATESELRQFVASQLSPEKHLYGGVKFVNEIPKSPAGKILKKNLRAL